MPKVTRRALLWMICTAGILACDGGRDESRGDGVSSLEADAGPSDAAEPPLESTPDGTATGCAQAEHPMPTVAACTRAPAAVPEGRVERLRLTVTGASTPDDTCFAGGPRPRPSPPHPTTYFLPGDRMLDPPSGERVGWQLTDEHGAVWLVEFIVPGLGVEALSVGSSVDLSFEHNDTVSATTGYFLIEVEEAPAVLVSQNAVPYWLDLTLRPGPVECRLPGECGGQLRKLEVTWAGETAELGTGQQGPMGDLVMVNDSFWDSPGCAADPSGGYVFAAFRL